MNEHRRKSRNFNSEEESQRKSTEQLVYIELLLKDSVARSYIYNFELKLRELKTKSMIWKMSISMQP